MSKLILDVDDNDINLFKRQYLSLPDLHEEIEKLLENRPDGRKRKELKEWKDHVNFLIDMYNTKSKFKSYNNVK
jgi:hypothetical protein